MTAKFEFYIIFQNDLILLLFEILYKCIKITINLIYLLEKRGGLKLYLKIWSIETHIVRQMSSCSPYLVSYGHMKITERIGVHS